jgi:hypothetical protein
MKTYEGLQSFEGEELAMKFMKTRSVNLPTIVLNERMCQWRLLVEEILTMIIKININRIDNFHITHHLFDFSEIFSIIENKFDF